MNLILFFILNLIVQTEWQRVAPQDKEFSIEVPVGISLEKSIHPSETPLGSLELVIFKSSDLDDIDNRYLLSYIDYDPKLHLDEITKDSMLQESILGLPGELIYQSDFFQDGTKGIILRKNIKDINTHLKSRVFFHEHRFYMLIVYAKSENSSNERIDKYLNSFRLDQTN